VIYDSNFRISPALNKGIEYKNICDADLLNCSITLRTVVFGCDGRVAIEKLAKMKQQRLKQELSL